MDQGEVSTSFYLKLKSSPSEGHVLAPGLREFKTIGNTRLSKACKSTLKEKDIHLILLLDDLGVLDQSRKSADFLLWLKNMLSLHV